MVLKREEMQNKIRELTDESNKMTSLNFNNNSKNVKNGGRIVARKKWL
jgi:hypothetical protein